MGWDMRFWGFTPTLTLPLRGREFLCMGVGGLTPTLTLPLRGRGLGRGWGLDAGAGFAGPRWGVWVGAGGGWGDIRLDGRGWGLGGGH